MELLLSPSDAPLSLFLLLHNVMRNTVCVLISYVPQHLDIRNPPHLFQSLRTSLTMEIFDVTGYEKLSIVLNSST